MSLFGHLNGRELRVHCLGGRWCDAKEDLLSHQHHRSRCNSFGLVSIAHSALRKYQNAWPKMAVMSPGDKST
jgi:hypothetical protein